MNILKNTCFATDVQVHAHSAHSELLQQPDIAVQVCNLKHNLSVFLFDHNTFYKHFLGTSIRLLLVLSIGRAVLSLYSLMFEVLTLILRLGKNILNSIVTCRVNGYMC